MWKKRDNSISDVSAVCFKNLEADASGINGWFKKTYANKYRLDNEIKFKEYIDRFKNKPIYIFGDYDPDGQCSVAIFVRGLKAYGCTNVKWRVPRPFSEGFGMNMAMINEIDDLPEDTLIITCDNGTSALDVIEEANYKGFKNIIVTDHHKPSLDSNGCVVLPDVSGLYNPHALPESADFDGYCGAGIAYKLIRYILGDTDVTAKLQTLAAIATVCDSVPLREENFVIVRDGIRKMNRLATFPGIIALFDVLNLTFVDREKNAYIDAEKIGFSIGPCLNACRRLDDDGANMAISLLLSDDYHSSLDIAHKLKMLNEQRKLLVTEGMKKAEIKIEEEKLLSNKTITALLEVEPGIAGIISGRLAERYNRPCIILSHVADGVCRGSGRSVDGIDLKSTLDLVASRTDDLMIAYGGHPMAAGITMMCEKVSELNNALNKALIDYSPKQAERYYDCDITDDDIIDVSTILDKTAPYGEGNPAPIFKCEFHPIPAYGSYKHDLGTNGVRLFSRDCQAVGFGLRDRFENIDRPSRITLYGTISVNYYRGKRAVQFNFIDFEKVEGPSLNKTSFAEKLNILSQKRKAV
ncbi:MAG: DHH family phosphoesterase [Eubacterium sp.]|nr:DHH family phosphoesterase [Eubacterium sp.]